MFRKSVWHGLDCFPVYRSQADYLFLSNGAIEDEIEASKAPRQGVRTELFNLTDHNVAFRIIDLK